MMSRREEERGAVSEDPGKNFRCRGILIPQKAEEGA
jgi:hypothetical protein